MNGHYAPYGRMVKQTPPLTSTTHLSGNPIGPDTPPPVFFFGDDVEGSRLACEERATAPTILAKTQNVAAV